MILETESLTKIYGSFTALDNCTLSVERGEVFGLLGPNGAGKTTLIRLVMGFLRPTSGTARLEGLNCTTKSVQVHNKVAYLPGDARLFRRMRGREVLRFFAGARKDGDFSKSLELANRLDLDIKRRVGLMSTGMRQKLALAATLATNATVMILDEPTANLDPNVRSEVIKMVLEAKSAGQTVLLSSHVLSEIEECCDRVVILRTGKLVHTQLMSDLRVRHSVTGLAKNDVPSIPDSLSESVEKITKCESETSNPKRMKLITVGDLAPTLDWISTIGLRDIRIEPLGLRSVYDRFHASAEVNSTQ